MWILYNIFHYLFICKFSIYTFIPPPPPQKINKSSCITENKLNFYACFMFAYYLRIVRFIESKSFSEFN